MSTQQKRPNGQEKKAREELVAEVVFNLKAGVLSACPRKREKEGNKYRNQS